MKTRFLPVIVATLLVSAAPLAFSGSPYRATSIPIVLSVEGDKVTIQNGVGKGMKVTDAETSKTTSHDISVKTYTVNKFTEIVINGRPMKLSDIKKGMAVTVTQGTDPTVAARIVGKADPSQVLPANQ